MLVYKVDPELNRVQETRNGDNLNLIEDHDLGSSDRLTIFSHYLNASLWIDQRLMKDDIPIVRINKKIFDKGVEFFIHPLSPRLEGSVYLVTNTGISRYNLIFRSNE